MWFRGACLHSEGDTAQGGEAGRGPGFSQQGGQDGLLAQMETLGQAAC